MLLNELLTSLKLSKKKFAEQLGLSQGNVSDWFNRPGYRPSIDALKRISDTYNVNLNWLITGEGEMFNTNPSQLPQDTHLITIPVSAPIAAGSPIQVAQDEPLETLRIPATLLTLPPPYYAFRVEGDSMSPFIIEGDTVILSRDWRGLKLHERICGFRTPDGITLKKLMLQPRQKTAWLMPINHHYNPTPYNKDTEELILFGVLVLLLRRF